MATHLSALESWDEPEATTQDTGIAPEVTTQVTGVSSEAATPETGGRTGRHQANKRVAPEAM